MSDTTNGDTADNYSRRNKMVLALIGVGFFAIIAAAVVSGDAGTDIATKDVPASTTSSTTPPTTTSVLVEQQANLLEPVPAIITFTEPQPPATSDYPWGDGYENDYVVPATTTSRITSTSTSSSTSTSTTTTAAPTGPAPVSISSPSCAAGLGALTERTAPFTGRTAAIPANMPAVVIKVSNNSSASRQALIGLDQADIVFEERIEASATRFFSVFHSSLPENVGPVRSGRTTDIQITQNLNNPVFAYSGSNAGVARQINFAASHGILTPFVNTDRAPFARDGRYSAPDNLFASPASLGACGPSVNPTAIFSYGPATSSTAKPASAVALSARSSYRFDWNGSTWARSQSGYAHTTRTGAPLAPKNVVVMFVPYVQSQIDAASVDAETIGSGNAWVFRDGTITEVTWRRNKGHEPYTFTDSNGTNVTLSRGKTWVVLAPAGTASWS